MSVVLKKITKRFGPQIAVEEVSFKLRAGEITGFLGPNGAGKSTTMKMITGYLLPDSGKVEVLGRDVTKERKITARNIGYLPEHNPLYPEMYVREFLRLNADFFDITNPSEKVEHVIKATGLSSEAHKKIGMLSKGYRQRVGLARAIVHDPEVLILDEPTSGLDPNQLLEIRSLIKQIGSERTVLFSSHIMQEVQNLSDRVIIISEGRIKLDAPVSELKQEKATQRLSLKSDDHNALAVLEGLPDAEVARLASGTYKISYRDAKDHRGEIFKYCAAHDLNVLELYEEKTSIEDTFREMTKKDVDDI